MRGLLSAGCLRKVIRGLGLTRTRWQLDGKQAGSLGAPMASPGPFTSRPHTGHPDPVRTHFDIGRGQEAASVEASDEDAAEGWQQELDVLSHEYSRLKTDIEVRALTCACPAVAHTRARVRESAEHIQSEACVG